MNEREAELMRKAKHNASMVEDLASDLSYEIEEEPDMAMGAVDELIEYASRLLLNLEDLDNTRAS